MSHSYEYLQPSQLFQGMPRQMYETITHLSFILIEQFNRRRQPLISPGHSATGKRGEDPVAEERTVRTVCRDCRKLAEVTCLFIHGLLTLQVFACQSYMNATEQSPPVPKPITHFRHALYDDGEGQEQGCENGGCYPKLVANGSLIIEDPRTSRRPNLACHRSSHIHSRTRPLFAKAQEYSLQRTLLHIFKYETQKGNPSL